MHAPMCVSCEPKRAACYAEDFSLKWILGQEQMEKECLLFFREIEGSGFLWPSLIAGRGWKKLIASVLGGLE